MKPTNIQDPEYFHQVVDCQYACPAHTPVPEYIRLIAREQYTDAYMVNWESNVFPGVLGRTCDRPCEPACRRGRVETGEEPVAICRLKRVAADNKGDVRSRMPVIPTQKNGKRIALIGGGPASLTVARDLMPLGYTIDLFDEQDKGGGFMRSQIPSFRLPETVLDEEVGHIVGMGVDTHYNTRVSSLNSVLAKSYDAVFVGSGAPRGRDLQLPGRAEGDANIHIGIDFLASVAFGHVEKVGERVLVIGGGNTAMDCCRTARRLGGKDVKIVVRSPFEEMKASPWEKEDAMHEGIPFFNNHVPKEFVIENGKLAGMRFEKVAAVVNTEGKRELKPTGEPLVFFPCDDVLMAVGQENAFPWIEADSGVTFDKWGLPVLDAVTYQSSNPKVFFGGDAAFGPKNIITAVAQGHQAAVSIDLFCRGLPVQQRPAPGTTLISQKMGIHEWSYDNPVSHDDRFVVPMVPVDKALKDRLLEVEVGFDRQVGFQEAQRCLNCDVQTVFTANKCIECDACVDICPTRCITFTPPVDDESLLRQQLSAPAENVEQPLYVSSVLSGTGRIMVKDEDVCLHCGLCAERCPTSAWDMQKYFYSVTKAGAVTAPAPSCKEKIA